MKGDPYRTLVAGKVDQTPHPFGGNPVRVNPRPPTLEFWRKGPKGDPLLRRLQSWAEGDSSTAGAKATGAAIEFATATGAWDTATHWGIFDASSGGNLLWWGSLDTGVAAVTGSVLKFLTGEIDLTLT